MKHLNLKPPKQTKPRREAPVVYSDPVDSPYNSAPRIHKPIGNTKPKHATDKAKLEYPPLDVKRDLPSMPRRPGSLDAYRLPSRFLGNLKVPTHHALGES